MARKLSMVLFAALSAVALLQSSVSATTYFVGDSSNWIRPSSPNLYSDWASNKSFVVGDILVFNFMQGQHDVAEVTKSSYDTCNGANPISLQTSSPANITLRSAGAHYYLCTISGHCSAGQKLAINVTGGAPTPSPQAGDGSPSPSPAPIPAPRPSSPSPSAAPTLAPRSSSPSPSAATPAPSTAATPPSAGATPPSSAATPPSPDAPGADTPTTTSAPPPPNGAAALSAAGFLSFAALALWFF